MTIESGQKLQGKVTGITKFGAFVDLGEGKSGMVHISQISNNFIQDINEELSVGDEVNVKVLAISDDGKISLSIKQAIEQEQKKNRSHSPKKENPLRQNEKQNFDDLMSSFLKSSDERLLSLKRNTEGKRGGRGGRRR